MTESRLFLEKPVKSTNILRIYDRLRHSPVTLDVLYDWVLKAGMDVSRRTLYRYLDDLAESIVFQGEKLVVYENQHKKKVWKIEFDESKIDLNDFDLNSYYFLRNFNPHSVSGPRESSLKKIDKLMYRLASKSSFQHNVDAHNMAFIRSNYIDAIYSKKDHELLEEIIGAIQELRQVQLSEYNWDRGVLPKGFETGMTIFPLKLYYHFGLIYVCAYSEDVGKIIVLPFTDILKMKVTENYFNPTNYLPLLDTFLKNTFGVLPNYDDQVYDITIEFSGYTGVFIKTMHWHQSQHTEKLANGNLLLHLRCGLNRELLGFVMYFLNNAKVLKPARLKDLVVERLQEMMDLYRPGKNEPLVYRTNVSIPAFQ